MSFLGSIGHAIKGGVHAVGKVAEKAAPFVGMIPGVGTLAAGAIGGLGGLAAGDGLSGALKYGAEGALGDIGAGLLGKIPGVGGVMGKLGLNAPTFGGGISALGHTLGIGGGAQANAPGAPVSQDNTYGDFPTGNSLPNNSSGAKIPGVGGMTLSQLGNANYGNSNTASGIAGLIAKYAPLALGAAGAFQNAQQSSQARDLTNQEVKDAQAARARQQALQDQVLASFKNPINAPDYTGIFSQTQNPFYRPPQATQMESRS